MKALTSFADSISLFADTFQYVQRSKGPEINMRELKAEWAQDILSRLKIKLEVVGTPTNDRSILFVGNHLSYVDIPLLMAAAEDLSFVAKEEVSSWPVIGSAAKKIDTVFVKRESDNSRKMARRSIADALENGSRVVIFPSGTTSMTEAEPWKKGAFEIAQENNCLIQPFRISYKPLRAVAYIDEDFLPWHLYQLLHIDHIDATIEFHPPVKVGDPQEDSLYWQYWARGLVDNVDSLS